MDLGRDQRLRSIETLDDFIYIYICTRTCISHGRNDRDLLRRRYEEDQGSLPRNLESPPCKLFSFEKIYLPLPSRIGRIRVGTGAKLVHELRRDD